MALLAYGSHLEGITMCIDWSAVTAVATIATCLVVIWYTVETQKLRRLSERQIELLVRPVVIARYETGNLYVRNIGQGSAFNVSIQNIELTDEVPQHTEYIIGFPQPVETLQPEQERMLHPFAENNGIRVAPDGLMDNLDPQLTQTQFTLTVEYDNVDGLHYKTKIEIGPGRWKVLPLKLGCQNTAD
jgi:hypothetical protein